MRDTLVSAARWVLVSFVLIAGCSDPPAGDEADALAGTARADVDGGTPRMPGAPGVPGAGDPAQPASPPRDGREPPPCTAGSELCDGVDNDCDEAVDEVGCVCEGDVPACFGGPPAARGVGECRDGTRACDAVGELWGPCEGWVGPTAETCNGLDDDCDGAVDECCDGACDRPMDAGAPPGDALCDPNGEPNCGDGTDPLGEQELFVVGEERDDVPVDFLMAVDNSGSMRDTVAQVEANLGTFATRLVDAAVDYRFVLISERGTGNASRDVCIPPPMAGPNCADTDRFRHLDEEVGSHSAFDDILECYDRCDDDDGNYRDFLRPGALLQVIVVTDDESDLRWDDFRARMAAVGLGELVLHGVVGLRDGGCVAEVGEQYIRGAGDTGGELLHICDLDWGQVLDVILEATVVRLQRRFVLARDADPATVRVYVVDAAGQEAEQVGNWRYDAATHAVVFDENADLPVGTQVVVRYR